ncbi:hypothetical protein Snoj_17790 [Streptomyces nojiriensis]|uniref:Uncharacterized protein n=1 Tax=Streptomyces nojiriensis TaxID=66374 RepID=A0ABQ3SIA4_9ACTN|nr:hypothetical protein GCM10010205_76660 [Streptomyces nojiriensis]GHI67861.1 hypothetical protein Snoj_17790 [Streptomyces nojiriensis]
MGTLPMLGPQKLSFPSPHVKHGDAAHPSIPSTRAPAIGDRAHPGAGRYGGPDRLVTKRRQTYLILST